MAIRVLGEGLFILVLFVGCLGFVLPALPALWLFVLGMPLGIAPNAAGPRTLNAKPRHVEVRHETLVVPIFIPYEPVPKRSGTIDDPRNELKSL